MTEASFPVLAQRTQKVKRPLLAGKKFKIKKTFSPSFFTGSFLATSVAPITELSFLFEKSTLF